MEFDYDGFLFDCREEAKEGVISLSKVKELFLEQAPSGNFQDEYSRSLKKLIENSGGQIDEKT